MARRHLPCAFVRRQQQLAAAKERQSLARTKYTTKPQPHNSNCKADPEPTVALPQAESEDIVETDIMASEKSDMQKQEGEKLMFILVHRRALLTRLPAQIKSADMVCFLAASRPNCV
jgi:uncharacterized membrane protein YdbT with pleckstrin-like domain